MDITTTKEFDDIINDKERKAVLIDFWAPWCGPCRMLTPIIDKLSEKITGQCVFMFTNMSPFKLNVLLGKNKVMLFARGGDTASMDVVIPP